MNIEVVQVGQSVILLSPEHCQGSFPLSTHLGFSSMRNEAMTRVEWGKKTFIDFVHGRTRTLRTGKIAKVVGNVLHAIIG